MSARKFNYIVTLLDATMVTVIFLTGLKELNVRRMNWLCI